MPNWQKLFTLPGHYTGPNDDNGTFAIALSPDGQLLATGGSDYNANLWDLRTRTKLHTFAGHANRIWGLAFSPDGQRLATASGDRSVRIWDVSSGYELLTIDFPGSARSLVFTRDNKNLVVTGDGGLVMVFKG